MAARVTSCHVRVAGIDIRVLRSGEAGPPLVLLHGTAVDSASLTYGPSLSALGEHFRVYAFDWPGYGESEQGPLGEGFPFLESFLREFLDAMELGCAHLAGFSMGGAAALGLALEDRQRVNRLVLIDSYGLGGLVHLPLLPYLVLRFRSAERPVWQALRRNRRLLRWFLATFVLGRSKLASPALVDEVHGQLARPGSEEAFMDWLRGEIRPGRLRTNYRARLRNLRQATLLLHGARDLIVPVYRARRAARLIPGARLVTAAGSGHWLPREAPEFMQREMIRFLQEVPE